MLSRSWLPSVSVSRGAPSDKVWVSPRINSREDLLRRYRRGIKRARAGRRLRRLLTTFSCWPAKKLGVLASCRSTKAGNNGWFTEGFDALALKEAKAMLAGLAS